MKVVKETREERLLRRVRAAYLEKLKKPRYAKPSAKSLANLKPRRDLPQIRRQCRGTKTDGGKCRAPAMKGARFCHKHGGRHDNPAHPGNLKRFEDGRLEMHARAARARYDIRSASPEALRAVIQHEAIPPEPKWHLRSPRMINRAQGAHAYDTAKRGDGRAWEQWIRRQPKLEQEWKAAPLPEYWTGETTNRGQ